MSRWRLFLASVATLASTSSSARAALTDSELGQIRAMVASARPADAAKLRALLARPDHAPADVTSAASDALRRVAFDEAHRAFLHLVLHGPNSEASRSVLVPAIVTGLLAREDELFAAHPSDLDAELAKKAELGEELVRIHAFVATDVASAGKPPENGHDPSTMIRDDALRAALDAYRQHLERDAKWLRLAEPSATPAVWSLRAQVAATTIELASGLAPKGDVAAWIGLDGALRGLFERTGTAVVVEGKLDAERTKALARALEASPSFADRTELAIVGKSGVLGVRTRGAILAIDAPVTEAPVPLAPEALWTQAVDPSRPDALVAAAAFEGARVAAEALAARSPGFGAASVRAAASAKEGGEAAYLGADPIAHAFDGDGAKLAHVGLSGMALVAAATRLVEVDAPRALDLALFELLDGRAEPLRQFQLALTLLATPPRGGALLASVPVGRARPDGSIEPIAVTNPKAGPDGVVSTFTLADHTFEIGASGNRTTVTRDGAPLGISMLGTARLPTREGDSWAGASRTYERLAGRPKVGIADDGRVRIVASRASGLEAAGFATKDDVVAVDLLVDAPSGALLLRAERGEASPRGLAILLTPGNPATIELVALRPDGRGERLADPRPIGEPGPNGWHVEARVAKGKLVVTVGGAELSVDVPPGFEKGDVGFGVKGPGAVEARGLAVGKGKLPPKKAAISKGKKP